MSKSIDDTLMVETLEEVLEELRLESDRGCVLVGAAAIDSALEAVIKAELEYLTRRTPEVGEEGSRRRVLKNLFSFDRPFGSLSAKIEFAFASGIIWRDIYQVLHGIRRLRNQFAHDYKRASFGVKAIREMVGKEFCEEDGYVPDRRATARNIVIRTIALNVGLLSGIQRRTKKL